MELGVFFYTAFLLPSFLHCISFAFQLRVSFDMIFTCCRNVFSMQLPLHLLVCTDIVSTDKSYLVIPLDDGVLGIVNKQLLIRTCIL